MSIEANVPESAATPPATNSDLSARDVIAASASSDTTNSPASADFVRAISDFLDTDPTDLLCELGYYDRDENR